MVTVVDALMITAGLDASGFVKNVKVLSEASKKARDGSVKDAADVEKAYKKQADSIENVIKSILGLKAVATGGKTFKNFIEDSVKTNTPLGVLNTTLGTSATMTTAWGIASARMGGSAASAQASIKSMSDALVDFRTQGKALPTEMFMLAAQSGVNVDFMHGVEKYMTTAAAAAKELAKTDPAAANRYLAAMGLDPATAQLMIQRGANIKDWLATQKKYAPTQRDIDAAKAMTSAQTGLSAAYDRLASKVMTALSPALLWLTNLLERFVMWMGDLTAKHPIWADALVGLFTLMSGVLALKSVLTILKLTGALKGLSGVGMGSGLMAWIAGGGLAAALAAIGVLGGDAAKGLFDKGFNALSPGANTPEMLENQNMSAWDRAKKIYHELGGGSGSGNDALRRRGHSPDIALGKGGNLTANQKEAYAAARAEGLSEKAARALVANMSGEGLHVPHDKHWDGSHYAHGIVQWDDVRSAAIKRRFGKMPEEMSVAEQTRAAIWEIRNNQRFAATKRALEGDNAGAMIDKLVDNYESPADKPGARARRSQIYRGLGNLGAGSNDAAPSAWHGGVSFAKVGGAANAAALNNISNSSTATTSTSSNTAHIGQITVNAPNTSDAQSVGRSIDKALSDSLFAQHANFGPA